MERISPLGRITLLLGKDQYSEKCCPVVKNFSTVDSGYAPLQPVNKASDNIDTAIVLNLPSHYLTPPID
jgi:hypothetical protein